MCSPYKQSAISFCFLSHRGLLCGGYIEDMAHLVEVLLWILIVLSELDIDRDELHIRPGHPTSSAPAGLCQLILLESLEVCLAYPGSLTSTLDTSPTSAPLPPLPSPYPVSSCNSRRAACLYSQLFTLSVPLFLSC